MTKKILYDRFFVSNQNFTTEHVKNVKIPGFLFKIPVFFSIFMLKMSNSRFFHVFKGFQGKWQPC